MTYEEAKQTARLITERRLEPRLNFRATVLANVDDGEQQPVLRLCQLFNISTQGLCIRLDRTVEEDAIVNLQVQFSGIGNVLRICARCRWCISDPDQTKEKRAFYIGLEVLESDQHSREDWLAWKAELTVDDQLIGISRGY